MAVAVAGAGWDRCVRIYGRQNRCIVGSGGVSVGPSVSVFGNVSVSVLVGVLVTGIRRRIR